MIIGISGYAGSGKSTLARKLVQNIVGVAVASMAAPVYAIAKIITGDSDFNKSRHYFNGKFTGRELLQRIGTEFGREMITQNIWVNLFESKTANGVYVCDDIRFPNEQAICDLKIHVCDANQTAKMSHLSEKYVEDLSHNADFCILRDGGEYYEIMYPAKDDEGLVPLTDEKLFHAIEMALKIKQLGRNK